MVVALQSIDGRRQSVAAPIAHARHQRQIRSNAAGHLPGRTVGNRGAQHLPGKLSHADFVAAVADADRVNRQLPLADDFEQSMRFGRAAIDRHAAHVVADVAMLRWNVALEVFSRGLTAAWLCQ